MSDTNNYDPEWTEQEFRFGGARDDLGIETLSESITADLLPGINNQTRRARYYSFWAWVLNGFIKDTNVQPHTQAKFWEWLRPREDTLIFAYLNHGCASGLAGTLIGARQWENGTYPVYDITWKSFESVAGGSYQLYYRGVLEEMNIIVRDIESPHDNLSQEIGLELAEAFEAAISTTNFYKYHLHSTQITIGDIKDFSEKGCICQLSQSNLERNLLVKAFFRFDSPDILAVKRLASLCFFLDIIKQSQDLPLLESDLRTVLYFWSYGGNHSFQPSGNCIEPAQRWRIFQLRQTFVFSIEAFWSLFLFSIQEKALTASQYLSMISENLNLANLSRKWKLNLSESNPSKLLLKDFFNSIYNSLPENFWDDGTNAMSQTLNENALLAAIRSDRTYLNVEIMAGSALLNLGLIYWRSRLLNGTSGWIYLSDSFAKGRMPLVSFIRTIDHAFENNWTVTDWVNWLHKNLLWNQHRRVALEKLLSRSQDVYKFEMHSDEFDSSDIEDQPRFYGLGLDTPKMNAPRFLSAINILADLVLIKPVQTGYRLTPEGEELLSKFTTYEVPQWKEASDDQAIERSEETAS